MPAPSSAPPAFNPPTWILSALAALVVPLIGWAFKMSAELTEIKTWKVEHEIWSERRSQNTKGRLDEQARNQAVQASEVREALGNVREDLAAIRGAVGIQKAK